MPASLSIMWSTARSEAALEAALPVPIEIRPLRGARRLRLRFDEASGALEADLPAGGPAAGCAGVGARPARLDRGAACPRRAGRAVRARGGDSARRAGRADRVGPGRAAHAGSGRSANCACGGPRARPRAADRTIPQAPRADDHVARGGRFCRGGWGHGARSASAMPARAGAVVRRKADPA